VSVELQSLAAWMDDRGLGEGPLEDPVTPAGGTQNVVLRFSRAGRLYVFRGPPQHKRANSDETMRREARVLAALTGTEVPHPSLIAAEADETVLGCAFYLMESVEGCNPTVGLSEPLASDPARQRRMGLSMATAIASVGRVDVEAAGVADLGRAHGWLERQVGRWNAQLASYASIDGYRGVDLPGVTQITAWLDAHRPENWTPGLIHGDFHFANVIVDPERGEVAAIVDWELATIGDPLLDLGHLLATWPKNPAGGAALLGGELARSNLPDPTEVVEHYAARSTRDTSGVRWYQVLACFRLGSILEGTNARADAGQAPRDTGDRLHAHSVSLFEQALFLIG
jgi:aminoglycoside phosphotransferase (APT) family kinase protein